MNFSEIGNYGQNMSPSLKASYKTAVDEVGFAQRQKSIGRQNGFFEVMKL